MHYTIVILELMFINSRHFACKKYYTCESIIYKYKYINYTQTHTYTLCLRKKHPRNFSDLINFWHKYYLKIKQSKGDLFPYLT